MKFTMYHVCISVMDLEKSIHKAELKNDSVGNLRFSSTGTAVFIVHLLASYTWISVCEKGISAVLVTFDKIDYETITEFLSWIEHVRKYSALTKNQRLSAISSFSAYAQNRDFTGATLNIKGKGGKLCRIGIPSTCNAIVYKFPN